jgi:sec-independent protein translocase protein TatA
LRGVAILLASSGRPIRPARERRKVFNIGTQEVLVVLLLVFLLFGPRHIPEVAHALGKGLGDFRRALQGIEDNVKRAGGDLPRIPRDLDDLDGVPALRPWGSSDQGSTQPVVNPPVSPDAASPAGTGGSVSAAGGPADVGASTEERP